VSLDATEAKRKAVHVGMASFALLLRWLDWRGAALCALGAFGPGILRELGWLRDQDEFQRRRHEIAATRGKGAAPRRHFALHEAGECDAGRMGFPA